MLIYNKGVIGLMTSTTDLKENKKDLLTSDLVYKFRESDKVESSESGELINIMSERLDKVTDFKEKNSELEKTYFQEDVPLLSSIFMRSKLTEREPFYYLIFIAIMYLPLFIIVAMTTNSGEFYTKLFHYSIPLFFLQVMLGIYIYYSIKIISTIQYEDNEPFKRNYNTFKKFKDIQKNEKLHTSKDVEGLFDLTDYYINKLSLKVSEKRYRVHIANNDKTMVMVSNLDIYRALLLNLIRSKDVTFTQALVMRNQESLTRYLDNVETVIFQLLYKDIKANQLIEDYLTYLEEEGYITEYTFLPEQNITQTGDTRVNIFNKDIVNEIVDILLEKEYQQNYNPKEVVYLHDEVKTYVTDTLNQLDTDGLSEYELNNIKVQYEDYSDSVSVMKRNYPHNKMIVAIEQELFRLHHIVLSENK